MNLQVWARAVQDQRLSDEDIAVIRNSANEMMGHPETEACGKVIIRLLNHIGIVTVEAKVNDNYLTERLKKELKSK